MGTILEAEDVVVGQTKGPTLMEQFFVFLLLRENRQQTQIKSTHVELCIVSRPALRGAAKHCEAESQDAECVVWGSVANSTNSCGCRSPTSEGISMVSERTKGSCWCPRQSTLQKQMHPAEANA